MQILLHKANINKSRGDIMIAKIIKIVIAILTAVFLIVGIPLIINESYKANCGYITVWDGADVLGYYGTILGAAIAVVTLAATIIGKPNNTC